MSELLDRVPKTVGDAAKGAGNVTKAATDADAKEKAAKKAADTRSDAGKATTKDVNDVAKGKD